MYTLSARPRRQVPSMLRQESRVKLRRDSAVSSSLGKSENNIEERVSLGNRSRESLRDRAGEKLSIGKSDSFPCHPPPAPRPRNTSLASPVSNNGAEIPRILVHTFGREETVESTLSTDLSSAGPELSLMQ